MAYKYLELNKKSSHWADNAAQAITQKKPKEAYVCASGISPSGVVHIGNFREVITVEFVQQAIKRKEKEVIFYHFWDDYDALRKTPKNLPHQDHIQAQMRLPLSRVTTSPQGNESYAEKFKSLFESELKQLGITPKYVSQSEAYESLSYQEGILKALEHNEDIKEILNQYRVTPLGSEWLCVTLYDPETGKDEVTIQGFEPPSTLFYRSQGSQETKSVDMTQDKGVKLLWRVDWPMRWAHYNVDFEPGGKDHSSTGGSFQTGKEILKKVWDKQAPFYVQYDFVLTKGAGSKLSSSSGELISLTDALKIYEPRVLRWLFASRKSNMDFSIAFDLDVLKAYDDFDRCERIAWEVDHAEEKKLNFEKRIYELSLPDQKAHWLNDDRYPTQFPFRHLANIVQIHEGQIEKVLEHYKTDIHTEADKERLISRAHCAWAWVQNYAPEEFCFRLKTTTLTEVSETQELIKDVLSVLEPLDFETTEDLSVPLFTLMKEQQKKPQEFFPPIYQALIGKGQGPKLGSFLAAVGKKRVIELLRLSCD